MIRALYIFGFFYLSVLLLVIGPFIGQNFLPLEEAVMGVMMAASVAFILVFIRVKTLDMWNIEEMEKGGAKLSKLLPLFSIIASIVYVIYSVYYGDYFLALAPYYWISKALTTFDWVFFALFNIISILVGTSVFAGKAFGVGYYVNIIYEEDSRGKSMIETSRSAPFIGTGPIFAKLTLGILLTCLFSLTPICLIFMLYCVIHFIYRRRINKVNSKEKFNKLKKSRRLAIILTMIFSSLIIITGRLYVNEFFDSFKVYEEFTLNNENFENNIKVEVIDSTYEGDSIHRSENVVKIYFSPLSNEYYDYEYIINVYI